jgi:hypothetical protein
MTNFRFYGLIALITTQLWQLVNILPGVIICQGDKVTGRPGSHEGSYTCPPDRMLHFVEENGTWAWSVRLYLPYLDCLIPRAGGNVLAVG